eukprot:477864_1
MTDTSKTLVIAIFTTIYSCLSFPFFIYGIIKWIQFQQHFLVQKRFPLITNGILLSALITEISLIPGKWLQYYNGHNKTAISVLGGITIGASFTSIALVIYRILLIYLRYTHSQNNLNQNESDLVTYKCDNNSIRKASIIFLIYLIICIIFIEIGSNSNYIMLSSLPWLTIILSGIILVIFVKCRKVSEGIYCLRETYVMLLFIASGVLISAILQFSGLDPTQIITILINVSVVPVQGLLPLYFSLYYIYKIEGILDVNTWKVKHKSEISNINASMTVDDKDINLKQTVFVFLKKKENCEIFALYCSHCFALENLLFVQNVSVLYQVITDKFIDSMSGDSSVSIVHVAERVNIARIKFAYLTDLYSKYETKLKVDSSNFDNVLFDDYRDLLYEICCGIYNDYIENGAEYEINISNDTKTTLRYLCSNENKGEKFKSFNDFLSLFDEALMEIYRLLFSIYSYRFVEYVEK